jgi:hypothetical protein
VGGNGRADGNTVLWPFFSFLLVPTAFCCWWGQFCLKMAGFLQQHSLLVAATGRPLLQVCIKMVQLNNGGGGAAAAAVLCSWQK